MEDYSLIIDKFLNNSNFPYFSLFDGHGGSAVVKSARDKMPAILAKTLSKSKDLENALINSFVQVDKELKCKESENMGTTACVVLVLFEEVQKRQRKVIYCANVGDTKCVLLSNSVKNLSYDHKCTDINESERIKKAGGVIFGGRVFGQLALTRALGDYKLKQYGVTSTPYVSKHCIEDTDRFIVMASDGIWDVFSGEAILKISYEINNADELCKYLVKQAISLGSQDNISCIVIKLN